ncbi:hypothetical protein NHX12_028174 [Muraenolepis orangiensis]|uniref:DNA-directed RNA polymerase III subunit n=1 Tax=Muraenolepis orangiensis TaxID=630683 RepID=A0A9Q0EBN7_9TELE|nr:hypothetical protein NHX12_028174 [Muraenolepis orangiensis]
MGGRGRGVAAFSFNVEALGITRGSMPEARVGPNPLYPNTECKPVPLRDDEGEVYMLALKQEMRGTMQRLPHNIKPLAARVDVERYKERYNKQRQLDNDKWTPDWNLLPKELRPYVKRPVKPAEKKDGVEEEKSDDEKPKTKKTAEGEEEDVEEEYEEEEVEEENDYIDSYFSNGEEFGGASDDNMDTEATY